MNKQFETKPDYIIVREIAITSNLVNLVCDRL